MSKKVLCVGQVAYDITLAVEDFPEENKKMRAKEKQECAGGSAFNSAYLLASWNIDTTFIGSVGDDEIQEKIKREAEEVHLRTKLSVCPGRTTTSYILANLKNGTRTIVTDKNLDLIYHDELPEESYDMLVLDSNEVELSLKLLEKYPEAISVIDAGKLCEEVLTLGKHVDYFVCSKDFAEEFTGIPCDSLENIKEAYEKIKSTFSNQVVITLEAMGSFSQKKKDLFVPSISVTPMDSTGAGDIYHGAFAYFLLQEKPLEEVMRYANIAGALSVTKLGSKESQPKLEEVLAKAGDLL